LRWRFIRNNQGSVWKSASLTISKSCVIQPCVKKASDFKKHSQ
jgi:hypothetical protein